MLGPCSTWAGVFLFQRQQTQGSHWPVFGAAKGKTGVSLSPQVLFLDIQAQWGVLFPYLAWAMGSPQRSPGIKGRESFPAAAQPNVPLLRVMSCFCKLHTILGHVVYYGAELVTYRGDEWSHVCCGTFPIPPGIA